MSTFRRLLPAATLAAAFTVGAPAANAAVPCFKTYANPGWKVQSDGSLMNSLQSGGSAGDQGYGRLKVGGVAYPQLEGSLCAQADQAMSMPGRKLGAFTVSRSISGSGGKLRWLDTITNPGGGQMVSVDFGLEVLGSQLIKTSESGNDSADADDHWTVHQSQTLFSTHQWGQTGTVAQPDVVSEDDGPRWEDDFGDMDDDATLRYSFFIGGGQTVRLLHAIGTAPSLVDAKASAQNAAGLLSGFSRSFADDIVNFGNDVDGDGVSKFADDCPSEKAETVNGCPAAVVPAPPADPVDPQAPAPPAPGETPATPQPDAAPVAPSGAAADQVGPVVTIGGVGTKLRRSKLTRRAGTKATIACSEDCRYTAKLVVKYRGRKQSTTVLRRSEQAFSGSTRDVRLRVGASKLRRLAAPRVTLVVEATDRSGNVSRAEQIIGLR